MPILTPLCGLRFGPAYARPSAYAPPYDVIGASERERLLAGDPHNIVHVDLGPAQTDAAWYQAAAATWAAWRAEGVLVQEALPSLYGYEQEFALGGRSLTRRGVLGCVRLAPWGEGIHRHERTRSGPRLDRLRLMRATRAQISPVFGLFRDDDGAVARWARPPSAPDLLGAFAAADGVCHRFWRIADPDAIAGLGAALAPSEIVIADGHHRYETALAYRDERRAADQPSSPRPYDDVLMYLTDAQAPGVAILPTHRVVACPADTDWGAFLAGLHARGALAQLDAAGSLSEALANQPDYGPRLGIYLGGRGAYVLTLHDPAAAVRAVAPEVPAALAGLDVLALQHLVLDPLLGISSEALAHSERVRYTIREDEARAWVDAGECQAAFVLNATTVDQVWQAATHGLTLPPKSSYFYPKLLTGLVMHALDGA
ncbi:MAG: DUF1015 domain-containing protein, partial [Chloroflexota bacterium]